MESRPPVPAAATETPVRQETRPDAARDLWESSPAGHLSEARINKADRVIEGCVLLNAESSNGPQGRRVYTDAALRQVAQMSEGLPAYANHVAKELAFKPRDVKEIIGRHRNARFDAGRHRVVTDLHVLEHQAPWVMSLTEDLGDVVGNSLVSRGFARMDNGVEYIDRIDAVRSGDLVSDPATTKGLFEHREEWTHRARPEGGDGEMEITLTGIIEFLKGHPVEEKALREHVAGEALVAAAKEKADLTKQLAEATAAKDTALAEAAAGKAALTESKAKLDGYAAADALSAKRTKLQEAVAAHDLGKRFGKIDGAVSPLFLTTCLEQDEAKWPGLFEDRLKIMDGASRGQQTPRSEVKQESGALPAGIHGRLSTALVG